MKYYKKVVLKNWKECIIRNAVKEEAKEILEHIQLVSLETENMPRYPEEYVITEDEERKFIVNMNSSSNQIFIVAEVDGKIVGSASFSPIRNCFKTSHRTGFGVAIKKAYWGYGIGNQIMDAIIYNARIAGYEQIELEVVTDNERAISLYKKFGFEIIGTNKWGFKTRDGKYQGLHYMLLRL